MTTGDTTEAMTGFPVTRPEQYRAFTSLPRRRILSFLGGQEATLGQLATTLGLSPGSVSYHLKILAEAELIRVSRTAKVRGGEQVYWKSIARTFNVANVLDNDADLSLGTMGADILRGVAEECEASIPGDRAVFVARRTHLTREDMAEFRTELRAVMDKFLELGAMPEDADVVPVTMMVSMFETVAANPATDTDAVAGDAEGQPTLTGAPQPSSLQ